MSFSSDSMTLVLPHTRSEATSPKDSGEVVLLAEANVSPQSLDLCRNNFSPIALMALMLKSLESQSAPYIMCVQYIGGRSVHRGTFSTSGGVQDIGGIP